MSRYIDADAVIDALYREKRNALMQDHNFVVRGIQASINCISNTPTIEPKRGEWIPCSERLPEENGRYLVTFPSLINKLRVDILWYGRPTFPETDHPCFYASDDEYGDVEYDDVVAWMPLPEPYEEREGE